MDLTRYVEELREQLLVASEGAGDEARLIAERLIPPLEATTRLVLLDALSAAADEITTELAPGSVDVRIRGRDPEFVVTSPPANQALGDAVDVGHVAARDDDVISPPVAPANEGEDGGTARITLRLPEGLKLQIEQAAGRGGLSVNAWLVRAVASAVRPHGGDRSPPTRVPSGGQHITGWAR